MSPQRVQMTRQRPWRAEHPDAVIVARPTRWGNPFRVGEFTPVWRAKYGWPLQHTPQSAVEAFRQWLDQAVPGQRRLIRADLAGRDLACWCPLNQPCHADVLLEIANGGAS